MSKDITTIKPSASLLAYSSDTGPSEEITFGRHRFYETADHQLAHDIEGVRRATVPPEGWDEYASQWGPECAEVVASLKNPAQ